MDYDLIVRGGMVIDGTGLPRRRVDLAVKNGRVVRIGRLDHMGAVEEIDATGMIVAPGIVDAHTHYDPQITFDPYATMSCFHGVTTVLAGNCGFSAAPTKAEDREFIQGVFAKVEDMNPIALSGVAWESFETFPEFLASLENRLGINFACYVGHSNVRRWVMGEAAIERAASANEIADMCAIVAEAMEAGAAGFSTSLSPTQNDIHGRPVPSRFADRDEVVALAEAAGRSGSGSICFLPAGTTRGLNDEDYDLIIEIGQRSGLPVVIQGLGARSKTDVPGSGWDDAVKVLDRAQAQGAPFYSMLIARPFDRQVAFDETNHHWQAVPTWQAMTRMPIEQRRALLRDPAAREEMRFAVENQNRAPDKGTTLPAPQWQVVFVEASSSLPFEQHQGRSIAEMANAQGVAPGDFALDLALADDFATKLRWRMDSTEWSDAVRKSQVDPRIIVGTSDGGAHLAKDDQADWSSYFLATWVRERKVWTLEEGIRQLTQVPAAILGFHDRGTLRVGGYADIMIFDEASIGPLRKEFVHDLPGGVGRYKAIGKGVKATIVNGRPIVMDGELTSELPGSLVRPS
ncbi:amidohydrolase family protein [Novosphingobium sp. G106]|uniref:N-acyl-D-amino-acid deacylase family protein n=1 Tax=Novosphingobium sp. G106 TaxID=2849500 RepID=UPI001C2CD59C|nr:amidohydrolase family protein [Novosphingobium sp. G106]MBV1687941.1 amidohydrolase family protein [Novosphingobium sp. G106]